MADIADLGNDTAEHFLQTALANVRPPAKYRGIGMCLNCNAEVDGERRWCDAFCRDDYEAAQARQGALAAYKALAA